MNTLVGDVFTLAPQVYAKNQRTGDRNTQYFQKEEIKKKIQAIKEQAKKSAKWAAKIEGCSFCGRNQAKKEQAGVERTKLYIQP